MSFEDYNPFYLGGSRNIAHQSQVSLVDIHNHQWNMPIADLNVLVEEMDSLNMAFMVNLSGFRGVYLQECLDNVKHSASTLWVVCQHRLGGH